MTNNLTNFNFDNNQVRTLLINDKPYFVGCDVAKALGYVNERKAISTHCKGVTKRDILTEGGKQEMLVIPEGDVFRLIIKSRLEKAQKFESWVMDEVLPQLRQTGKYEIIKQPQPKTNLINLDLSNSIIKLLKDKDCLLTWNDMIEISHKRDVKEVCRFLGVKCISQKRDINQLISTLENQQEFLKLEAQNLIGNEKLLTATEIGAILGISALKVGKIANVLNLKCEKYGQWFRDKASHSIKEVQTFKYNGNVVDKIKHYLANGQNIA